MVHIYVYGFDWYNVVDKFLCETSRFQFFFNASFPDKYLEMESSEFVGVRNVL